MHQHILSVLLQFWNLPWWHCSAGACIDTNTDDIGYMEKLFTLIPQRFSVDKSKVSRSYCVVGYSKYSCIPTSCSSVYNSK